MKPRLVTRTFCKTARCPSSETLLRYRRSGLTFVERLTVERHLRNCDFCSAETQLLKRHRLEVEQPEPGEMPSHLRKLAASLFNQTGRMGEFMVRSPCSH